MCGGLEFAPTPEQEQIDRLMSMAGAANAEVLQLRYALEECRSALNDILYVNGDGSTAGGDTVRGWTGGSGHSECRKIARSVLKSQNAYVPEGE